MLLIAVPAWTKKYFSPESAPSVLTVRRWLRNGSLPGRKIGGTWFVDEHEWLADGDELVLRVLARS